MAGLAASHVTGDTLTGLPEEDAARIRHHLAGVVLGPAQVEGLSRATTWLPLREVTYEYVRPSGGDATLRVAPTHRSPGHPVGSRAGGWRMDVSDGPTRYLREDAEGAHSGVVVPTDVSIANGLLIRLNPPEPMLLEATTSDSRDIAVKISDIHDPAVVTHSGRVTCEWKDLGGWRVRTPAGEFDTRLVRVSYSGSVGPASVSGHKYTFYAPQVGPVAFTDARDISAFLFFSDDTSHAGVLKRSPGGSQVEQKR